MKSTLNRVRASRRRFWLTYPPEKVPEPVLWKMSQENDVAFNLRTASATDQGGLIALELEGTADAIETTVRWLRRQGVQAHPIELNAIES